MYEFNNLPTKKSRNKIQGIVAVSYFRIQTDEGWSICTVGRTTEEQTAHDIADAIRFARDAGYQQALADVRRQLGIK